MRFSTLLLAVLAAGLVGPLQAVPTDTNTPTATPTVTATATVTPGPGSWSLSIPSVLVYGSNGNSAIWTYTAGEAWTNGRLVFTFPDGLSAPTTSNFYVKPSKAGQVGTYSPAGQSVSVDVISLAMGDSLQFYYGYNASGYAVSTTITPLGPFSLTANSTGITAGGIVTPVTVPLVAIATATVTPTATPTATITATFTATPTISQTFTVTQTYTETPVAAAPISGVFTYPNPFDMRLYQKITIRFQPTTAATVQIFNLLGEPVCTLSDNDIYPGKGWAIWNGVDDYGRMIVGGLYFVRVKVPDGVLVRKFTVLH